MPACERDVQVGPYHDGELAAAERAAFEAHLAGCPDCAAHLEGLRGVARRLEPVRQLTLPQLQRQRLLDMAEAVARRGASPVAEGPAPAAIDEVRDVNDDESARLRIGPAGRAVRWVRWLTAAAAAVFLFSVVQLFLARRGGPGPSPPVGPGGTPAVHRSSTAPADKVTPAQPQTEDVVDR